MFPAPLFLLLLVLASPVCLIFDGPITYGAVAAVVAFLLLVIAFRTRPGEAQFLSGLVFPYLLVAAIPAVVILIQLLPLRGIGFANSIWQSASIALSRPVLGGISIDLGTTMIGLARYLSLLGLIFTTAAISLDRHRAGLILSALTVTATFSALIMLAVGPDAMQINVGDSDTLITAATDAATLGIVLAIAMVLQIRERATISSPDKRNLVVLRLELLLSLAAVTICSLAVYKHGSSGTHLALAFGIIMLVVAGIIRRFQLDAWGYSAVIATVMIIAVAALALRPGERIMDFTTAFAAAPQSPLIELSRRISAETGWLGTGAGTFAAVLPIYRDVAEVAVGDLAPTAAAAIAIEMGKPFLFGSLIAGLALVVALLRGAVRRGRDACYPIAGASCAIVTLILAFNNSGLFNTSVLVILAVTLGLAIAQSKSRPV
jgi:hypothetical protein